MGRAIQLGKQQLRHLEPHSVVCYWESVQTNDRWKLVESYGIDGDGYPITTPSTGGGRDRCEWDKWLYSTSKNEQIMGRAVTMWSIQCGVRLLGFNPPKPVPWLSNSFYEEICKDLDWRKIIEGGPTMWFWTAREAEKYIRSEK